MASIYSVFFLLFLLEITWASSPVECPRGWIPTINTGECIPCPQGFFCNFGIRYPVLCSPGTYSLEGSERCCPKNMTCPVGFAVNANEGCLCTSIECRSSLSDLERSHGREKRLVYDKRRNWIICKDERELSPCGIGRCHDVRMIQYEESCICTRSTRCMNSNLQTQYWFSTFENSFHCVSTI